MGGADHRSFTALEGSGLPSDLRQQGKRSITVTEEDLAGPTQNHTRQSIFVYPEANFLFPSQKSAYRLLEGHRYELTAMLFFYSFFYVVRCVSEFIGDLQHLTRNNASLFHFPSHTRQTPFIFMSIFLTFRNCENTSQIASFNYYFSFLHFLFFT